MRQQFAGQTATYQARFPQACFEILQVDDVPIGRVVTDVGPETVPRVDIALVPDWRGRGIGTAIIQNIMTQGHPIELMVATHNAGALRLYCRLGFIVTETVLPFVAMRWSPGDLA